MSQTIKPCHCGHDSDLMGMRHKEGFLSLTCPKCNRSVEGMSMRGLMDEWQKPAPTPPQENDL